MSAPRCLVAAKVDFASLELSSSWATYSENGKKLIASYNWYRLPRPPPLPVSSLLSGSDSVRAWQVSDVAEHLRGAAAGGRVVRVVSCRVKRDCGERQRRPRRPEGRRPRARGTSWTTAARPRPSCWSCCSSSCRSCRSRSWSRAKRTAASRAAAGAGRATGWWWRGGIGSVSVPRRAPPRSASRPPFSNAGRSATACAV